MRARTVTRSSTRRRTIWMRQAGSLNTGAPNFVTFFPLTDAPAGSLLGATLTRCRGMILAQNATTYGIGIMGLQVVSSVAPLTAADTPLGSSGREDDWLGYVPFSYRPLANSLEAVTFDVKGQRRLDELGMTLLGVFDVGSGVATTVVNYSISCLITLP